MGEIKDTGIRVGLWGKEIPNVLRMASTEALREELARRDVNGLMKQVIEKWWTDEALSYAFNVLNVNLRVPYEQDTWSQVFSELGIEGWRVAHSWPTDVPMQSVAYGIPAGCAPRAVRLPTREDLINMAGTSKWRQMAQACVKDIIEASTEKGREGK